MYDALEIARHVINYCNAHNYSISNLKLQKLLYFIQAFFLIVSPEKKPCFNARIEAWDFGPVVPEVYSEFKQYGSSDISAVRYYYISTCKNIFKSSKVEFNDDVISERDKKLIDAVIEKFKRYSATALVKITHNQETWKRAYKNKANREITIDALREYFQ